MRFREAPRLLAGFFQIDLRSGDSPAGGSTKTNVLSQFSTEISPGVSRPAFSSEATACRARRVRPDLKFFWRRKAGLGFKGQGGVCHDPSRSKSARRWQVFVFSRARRSFDKLRLQKAADLCLICRGSNHCGVETFVPATSA
jgi:hypothetical protein